MNVFLAITCGILLVALTASVIYNIKFGKIIVEMEDALTEALDVCDQSYKRMSAVIEMPVALNTPEVRQILQDIGKVRDAVLYVSNVLAEPYDGIIEEGADDTKS